MAEDRTPTFQASVKGKVSIGSTGTKADPVTSGGNARAHVDHDAEAFPDGLQPEVRIGIGSRPGLECRARGTSRARASVKPPLSALSATRNVSSASSSSPTVRAAGERMVAAHVDDRRLRRAARAAARPSARLGAQNSTARSSRPAAHVAQQRAGRVLARVEHHAGRAVGARGEQRRPDAVARGRATSRSAAGRPRPRRAPARRRTRGRRARAAPRPLLEQHAPARRDLARRGPLRSSSATPELLLELLDRRAQRRAGRCAAAPPRA